MSSVTEDAEDGVGEGWGALAVAKKGPEQSRIAQMVTRITDVYELKLPGDVGAT